MFLFSRRPAAAAAAPPAPHAWRSAAGCLRSG